MTDRTQLRNIAALKGSRSRPVTVSFTPSSWDDETHSIEATWYAGTPVRRYSYDEGDFTLSFDMSGANLARLNAGAAVLKDHRDHDSDAQIGKVVEGTARVQDGKGLARIQFSRDPAHAGFVQDVRDGIRRNLSMGVEIDQFTYASKKGVGTATETHVIATAWQPYEVSFVPVGADQHAQTLSDQPSSSKESNNMDKPLTQADLDAAKLAGIQAERERIRLDQERRTQILQMSRHVENAGGSKDFVAALAADESVTVATARERVMAEAERLADAKPINTAKGASRVEVGSDGDGKLGKVFAKALAVKMGATAIKLSDEEQALVPFLSARRLAEQALQRQGVQTAHLSDEQILTRAFERCDTRAALARFEDTFSTRERLGEISTSDLPLLFGAAQALVVMDGYQAVAPTYTAWCGRVSMADFRPIKMVDYSRVPLLAEIPESGVPEMGALSESGEEVGLKEWGIAIPFSRRSLINDRYDIIGGVARSVGRRVAVAKNNRAYGKLTSNSGAGPTLSDSVAVFHSSRANVGTTGALAVGTLGELRKKLKEMKGLADPSSSTSGMRLNLAGKVLVCGSGLETAAEQLLGGLYVPTAASGVLPQSLRSGLTLVSDAEISSTTAYYMFPDPSIQPVFVESTLGDEGILVDMVYSEESRGVKLIVRTAYDFTAVSPYAAYNAGA